MAPPPERRHYPLLKAGLTSKMAAKAGWRPQALEKDAKGKSISRGKKHKKGEAEQEDADILGEDDKVKEPGAELSILQSAGGGTSPQGGDKSKTPRGGRRARKNAGKDYSITVRDKGLKSLVTTLSKLVLRNSLHIRMLWAGVLDVAIGSETSEVVRSISEEGAAYGAAADAAHEELNKLINEKKTQKEIEAARVAIRDKEPPSRSNYVAMVEQLSKLDVGGANKTALSEYAKACEATPPNVCCCKLASVRSAGQIMIILGHRELAIRETVNASLIQVGFRVKTDSPPPSPLEDELGGWLEALEA